MTTQTTSFSGTPVPTRQILLPFFVFILFVGGSPVAIRITYAELSPFWMGVARFGTGALIFWALAFFRRLELPRGRALMGTIWYGVFGIGLSFILLAWGLVKTSASLGGILLAMVPLMTIFLSAFQGVEVLSARGIIGSLLAVVGTLVTVGGAPAGEVSLPHILSIIAGVAFLAQSGVLIKRFPATSPIMTNAIGMSVGALILVVASLIAKESWVIPVESSTWAALVYLVVFVTVISFVLYLQVLEKWTASGVSYGFVIIPLVTFVIAVLLADEVITANFIIGAILVLVGVAVGALLPAKQKPDAVEECRDSAGRVLPRCI